MIDITAIEYTPQRNPILFKIVYQDRQHLADLTLTLMCKSPKHAQRWVDALRLLCHAWAYEWGLGDIK